jgi:hypothetical protein
MFGWDSHTLMTVANIASIKHGDLTTAKILQWLQQEKNQDISIFFSGLDLFDVAYGYELTNTAELNPDFILFPPLLIH